MSSFQDDIAEYSVKNTTVIVETPPPEAPVDPSSSESSESKSSSPSPDGVSSDSKSEETPSEEEKPKQEVPVISLLKLVLAALQPPNVQERERKDLKVDLKEEQFKALVMRLEKEFGPGDYTLMYQVCGRKASSRFKQGKNIPAGATRLRVYALNEPIFFHSGRNGFVIKPDTLYDLDLKTNHQFGVSSDTYARSDGRVHVKRKGYQGHVALLFSEPKIVSTDPPGGPSLV